MVASSVPASSMELPLEEMTNGILPHLQLIKNACEKNVAKIIYISSGGGVYGNKQKQPVNENALPKPISPHAIGKLTIEYYLRYFSLLHDIPYVSYRMSNVYGPRQIQKKGFGIIPTLFSSVTQDIRPIIFNQGKLARDFVYIDDAIKAISISFNKKNKSHTYNIGSGTQTSLHELWMEITRLTRSKLKPIFKSKRTIDIDKYALDISLFSKEYNWTPHTNLHEGLDKTWGWIKNANQKK
jgi:UDP-glucose 4-epimerase